MYITPKLRKNRRAKIKIISIEEEFNEQIDIKGLNFPIKIKGKVDRIDIYNNT